MDTGGTVLVVDDDLAVRRLAVEMLEMHGYVVIEADSGSSGVDCLAEHNDKVDLVLSDIVMPKMSGPEMIEQILKIELSVRVMFMSGYASDAIMPESVQGKFPVLSKPFTPDMLVRTVRECLANCP